MYVKAPVSSNMMTTTVTVMRMTPLHEHQSQDYELEAPSATYLSAAAAPRNA
jgi:hypothetical protein